MAEIKKNNKRKLRFNRTDICLILDCDYRMFRDFMPDHIKKKDYMKKGIISLTDEEALEVIQAYRPLMPKELIINKLYPNGF